MGINVHSHEGIATHIMMLHPELWQTDRRGWEIKKQYHRGGYARWNAPLIALIREFQHDTDIVLAPVYTAKAMVALKDLMRKGEINDEQRVLFMHTGGLQGIAGFEERFGPLQNREPNCTE